MSRAVLVDPSNAAADPLLPQLAHALDPLRAGAALARDCPALAHQPPLGSIRVVRHRPGRRCLVRYGFADGTPAVLGKASAKGVHNRSLAAQTRLHAAGFTTAAADCIAVPEPLGAVPSLGLWLQREVAGRPLQAMLGEPAALAACERTALALAKLHRVPAGRAPAWTMADELAVLDDRLRRLAIVRPDLAARAARLLDLCRRAASRVPLAPACGIHRDFYPEQVLVDGASLHLVDLDLWSRGDPALDAGNFVAHLIEAAIRATGDPGGYDRLAKVFVRRFSGESPAVSAPALAVYTALSLARLVQISTVVPERRHATAAILEAAEAAARATQVQAGGSRRGTTGDYRVEWMGPLMD